MALPTPLLQDPEALRFLQLRGRFPSAGMFLVPLFKGAFHQGITRTSREQRTKLPRKAGSWRWSWSEPRWSPMETTQQWSFGCPRVAGEVLPPLFLPQILIEHLLHAGGGGHSSYYQKANPCPCGTQILIEGDRSQIKEINVCWTLREC